MNMSEWLVLVNPLAGKGRHADQRTRGALAAYGIGADVVVPTTPTAMRIAVDAGVEEGRTRFVAVGGDGTANLVADQLLSHPWSTPPVLGLLPGGSGSDLARSFEIPQRIEDAVATLRGDAIAIVDVGVLEGRWGSRRFVNCAESGLTAAVLHRSMRLPRWLGSVKYHLALGLVYPRVQLATMTVRAGGNEFRGSSLLAVFANGRYFAGGWKIAPEASVSDGLFDIQVFEATKRDIPRLWWLAKSGAHVDEPNIHHFTAETFTLEVADGWPIEADGEYFGEGSIRGSIIRSALSIKILDP
jgi:YegS/Rv2252/BmrU family lipid kinase